jgi:hypothetical protein
MSDLPPELRPESDEDHTRRVQRMWLGLGVPTLIAAVIALALGMPWWIVLIFIVVVAVGVVLAS